MMYLVVFITLVHMYFLWGWGAWHKPNAYFIEANNWVSKKEELIMVYKYACAGISIVPQEKPELQTPPAVDFSMSPSSRHMPCSPELTNGNGSSHLFLEVSERVHVLKKSTLH